MTDREALGEFGAQFPDCPEPAMVQAAQSGVLPAEMRDRLLEHVAHCDMCASLANDLFALDEAPLEARSEERIWGRIRSGIAADELRSRAAPPRWAWWRMPIAVAATVALVAIGIRFAQRPQAPIAVVSRTVPPKVEAPRAPSVLAVDKPAVMLPAAAVLVWRGASDAGNAPGQELREALVPYEADRYAEAAERLEGLAKKYPAMAEAHFYLGICRLFMDRNADAATSLKAAQSLARPALAGETSWYLALAYHRSGRDGDARPLLEKLCTATAPNSAKACAGLKELSVVQ